MIDHLVLFTVRDDASGEDVRGLLGALAGLKDTVPGVIDLSVGENFSERSGGYTHALFARFRTADDLKAYAGHPDHLSAVEKLDALTIGERVVVDYEHGD